MMTMRRRRRRRRRHLDNIATHALEILGLSFPIDQHDTCQTTATLATSKNVQQPVQAIVLYNLTHDQDKLICNPVFFAGGQKREHMRASQ